MKGKILLLCSLLGLISCNNEDELFQEIPSVTYSFKASINDDPETRVSYTYDGTNNKLKCSWQKNDQIKLISSADGSEFLFKATAVSGGVATFTYQGTEPIHNADEFNGVAEFVIPIKAGYEPTGLERYKYANNSIAEIQYGEYMSATLSNVDLTDGTTQISLKHQRAIYKVTIPAPENISYHSWVVIKGIKDANEIEQADSACLSWGTKNIAIQKGQNLIVYIVGKPGHLNSGDKLRIIIKQGAGYGGMENHWGDEYHYIKTVNTKTNFNSGKLYNLTTTKTSPDFKAVDLGLPSKTKWAEVNIGAETAEGYGNFFRWGEAESGFPQSEISTYYNYPFISSNWVLSSASYWALESTYKFPKGDFRGVVTTVSGKKYGDAATSNWSPDWKVPTKEQIAELITQTQTTETLNGVTGKRVTSKKYTQKSIFFPFTGFYTYTELYGNQYYGEHIYTGCWSSTYKERISNVNSAYYLDFDNSSAVSGAPGSRASCTGLTIRPITQ